jgi:DNA modification methylase
MPAKNTLNDLTGGEWLFRSKSVIKANFGSGSFAHAIRRQANKSCKPPELCKTIVEVFTKKGDTVLDPFAGTGGIVIGAQMAGRQAIGCELDILQVEAYKQACRQIGGLFSDLDENAINVVNFFQKYSKDQFVSNGEHPLVDMVFTDPPFFDMDKRKKSQRWWVGKGSQKRPMEPFKGVIFSSLDDWLTFIQNFSYIAFLMTKPGKHMVYFMEDAYLDGEYVMLTSLAAAASSKAGWSLQGEYIWYNEARRPGIFGYPVKMITNRTHTSILFFKKPTG